PRADRPQPRVNQQSPRQGAVAPLAGRSQDVHWSTNSGYGANLRPEPDSVKKTSAAGHLIREGWLAAGAWYDEIRSGRQSRQETLEFVRDHWQVFLPVVGTENAVLAARLGRRNLASSRGPTVLSGWHFQHPQLYARYRGQQRKEL